MAFLPYNVKNMKTFIFPKAFLVSNIKSHYEKVTDFDGWGNN